MTETIQTSFSLSSEDRKKVQTWLNDIVYEGKNPPYSGAIGGNVSYIFTPTSIGVVVEAIEAHSGLKLDLSDYHEW